MLLLAKVLIALVAPLLLGALVAQLVRMPQYMWRIALVMYATILPAIGLYPLKDAMRLGIDLSGGTILVYQVKHTDANFDINKMVTALSKRINPSGVVDVTIRGIGKDRVEIIIPRAAQQEVERCKRILTTVGSLEFRILCNQRDHASLIAQAKASFPRPVMSGDKIQARWIPVAEKSVNDIGVHGNVAVQRNEADGRTYALVYQDPYDVTGDYLQRTSVTEERGQPAVSFHFNPVGASRFGNLTAKFAPMDDGFERRLAILLNGEVYTAPNLHAQISSDGVISGHFTQESASDLVAVLNAGSLPGELVKTPVSELTIGPTLGGDTIHSGLMAMAVATIVVLIFMAFYYHVAGLIADLAVILNCLIVVGVMAFMHGTWTLAGLAGLALTVGMAVDANVLIYERLREEQQRGRTLRSAIEHAHDRALSPILDSHITTLLSGAVLYAIGSEQVKGFAVTLIIGLLANLFTAVFVCRLVLDIIERNNWVKRFSMLTIFGHPNFDFVGKRRICVGASAVLIVVGLASLFLRGTDMLDIDFTGGTVAAVHFVQPTDSGKVRALAAEALNDEWASVEELQLRDEPSGTRFLIRTTVQNPADVKKAIADKFGKELAHVTLQAGPIEAIPKDAAPSPPASGDAGTVTRPTFAGGNRVELTFNEPVAMDSLRSVIEAALAQQGVSNAGLRYDVVGLGAAVEKPTEKPAEPAAEKSADKPADKGAEATAAPAKTAEYAKVRLETDLSQADLEKLLPAVGQRLADQSMFERLENFGSQVAAEMQSAALVAIVFSMIITVIYLWLRFRHMSYGLGALVATLHDVSVVVGLLAASRWVAGTFIGKALMIEDFKINLPVIAALLTLVGYSLSDTIVVFDRIREVKGKRREVTWSLINESVNQTLSRTILTSVTVLLVALILYIMGGSAIHGLSFCLVTGVIVGTYSSIYIASPFLVWVGATDTRRPGRPAEESGNESGGDEPRRRKRNRA